MPTEYPLPPWLHGVTPSEIGSLTLESQRAGAQIAMERARLQQQAQAEANSIAARAQEAQQRHQEDMARLQAQTAYQKIQSGIQQQELQQRQQAIEMQAQAAAHKFAAMQKYRTAVEGGMDPQKALLTFGPEMGQQGTGESAAIRGQMIQNAKPPQLQSYGGEDFLMVPGPSGLMIPHQIKHQKAQSEMTDFQRMIMLNRLEQQRQDVLDKNPKIDPSQEPDEKWPAIRKSQFKNVKSRIQSIDAQITKLEGGQDESAQQPQTGAKRFRYDPATGQLKAIENASAPSDSGQEPSEEVQPIDPSTGAPANLVPKPGAFPMNPEDQQ